MRDRPTGAELLREVQRVLKQEVAPGLSGGQRFNVLMAANAVGMAMRELEQGEAPPREEYAALSELYEEARATVEDGDELEDRLLALNRRFAEDIRQGRRDGEGRSHRLLLAEAKARVQESNPAALK